MTAAATHRVKAAGRNLDTVAMTLVLGALNAMSHHLDLMSTVDAGGMSTVAVNIVLILPTVTVILVQSQPAVDIFRLEADTTVDQMTG